MVEFLPLRIYTFIVNTLKICTCVWDVILEILVFGLPNYTTPFTSYKVYPSVPC